MGVEEREFNLVSMFNLGIQQTYPETRQKKPSGDLDARWAMSAFGPTSATSVACVPCVYFRWSTGEWNSASFGVSRSNYRRRKEAIPLVVLGAWGSLL